MRDQSEQELADRRRELCEEQWRKPGVGNHHHVSGWVDEAWLRSHDRAEKTLLGDEKVTNPYNWLLHFGAPAGLYKMRGRRVAWGQKTNSQKLMKRSGRRRR